jgi:hypothetical protein
MSSNRRKIKKRAKPRVAYVPPRKKAIAKQTKKKVKEAVPAPAEDSANEPSISMPAFVIELMARSNMFDTLFR